MRILNGGTIQALPASNNVVTGANFGASLSQLQQVLTDLNARKSFLQSKIDEANAYLSENRPKYNYALERGKDTRERDPRPPYSKNPNYGKYGWVASTGEFWRDNDAHNAYMDAEWKISQFETALKTYTSELANIETVSIPQANAAILAFSNSPVAQTAANQALAQTIANNANTLNEIEQKNYAEKRNTNLLYAAVVLVFVVVTGFIAMKIYKS